MANETKQLADYVAGLAFEALPGEVVARAVHDGRLDSSDEEKLDVDVGAEKRAAGNAPEVGGGGSGLPEYSPNGATRAV